MAAIDKAFGMYKERMVVGKVGRDTLSRVKRRLIRGDPPSMMSRSFRKSHLRINRTIYVRAIVIFALVCL
jgi:hypothetical protein